MKNKTIKVRALRSCSISSGPMAFDLEKNEIKAFSREIVAILLRRGYAEMWADPPEWTVKTLSPFAYLRRWPNGPKAELAKELLGLSAMESTT